MSRGPGRVERVITEAFEANPSTAYGVDDLVRRAFPDVTQIEGRHRVSVVRAGDKVAFRLGWARHSWCRRTARESPNTYYNPTNLRSYLACMARACWLPHGAAWAAARSLRDATEEH